MMNDHLSRRQFLKSTAIALPAIGVGINAFASAESSSKIKLGVFSKHLQWLNYEDAADAVAEIGWDGIECPVRPKGHVLPERVEEDLPGFAEALKKRNLEILMATTAIHDVREPYAEKILRTVAKLGIKRYRIGDWKYKKGMAVPERLGEIQVQLKGLVALNRELGITAAYQNHSGVRVGAAVWDIYEMIKDLDARYIGSAFDIGHATVEGGYAWQIHFNLMKPFIKAVIVKDFHWVKLNNGRWKAQWVPLGQGMVRKDFFAMLKAAGYAGPIIQHFEYKVEGRTAKEEHKNLIKAMKRDCRTLKSILRDVGMV